MVGDVTDKTMLDAFTIKFSRIVEKHIKYVIVSGFVVIAHGRCKTSKNCLRR